jgi:hypothetical protein
MTTVSWDPKDPDETLDYEILWSERIPEGDSIILSNWEVPTGLGNAGSGLREGNLVSVIWLSGGTIGETYSVVNTVETMMSRTFQQTVKLKIKAR